MQIVPVDPEHRLWQVTDLLSPEQVDAILAVDWLNLRTRPGHPQHFKQRREIAWDEPAIAQAFKHISDQLPAINRSIGTSFTTAGGSFWVDLPGFSCPMHTDGHLNNSMQIYWIAPNDDYGTGFYYNKQTASLKYQFASRPNTGYIMLNHLDSTGAQPLQWHAMFNTVPEGHIRVSSYWQFG